jgi:hypothetical protein
MALINLWNDDRQQIVSKRVDQLIAFAGEGRLRDGSSTALEFRALLSIISSDLIGRWLTECLDNRFQDFGFVLQDIVNEIGRRLGFNVTHGVYRGHSDQSFDGAWTVPGGRTLLIESKSSAAYSIDLERISDYRAQLAPNLGVPADAISILLVVGSEDTSSFEAQVRGSRYAWDIRLLGVNSLFRLLKLKETLDDPKVEKQIQGVLFPQEFTRLDGIIDLVFATAEDAQLQETSDAVAVELIESDDTTDSSTQQNSETKSPASFHAEVLPRLEKAVGASLVKRSRVLWGTPDESVLLSCQVSKLFEHRRMHYWFGLKRATREVLDEHSNAFCAFGLGSSEQIVLIPYKLLAEHLDGMFTSPDDEGGIRHWHVRFQNISQGIALLVDRDRQPLDVSKYLLNRTQPPVP